MEVYNVAPCAAWVILSGIYMISGINLFRGKGTALTIRLAIRTMR